jgi:basic membrane protein A
MVAVLAAVLLVAVACSKKTNNQGQATTGGGKPGSGLSVCLVSDEGGFDDKGFNQLGADGVKEAQTQLGVKPLLIQSNNAQDYTPNIQSCLSQGADLIITQGFNLADATEAAAKQNPDQKFAIIDYPNAAFASHPKNILGLSFQTDQAAFLAGYVAAGVTKSGTVGTFGGDNIPTVTIFMNGFAAGILKYNQDTGKSVKLLGWDPAKQDGTFTGDFTNVQNGRADAEDLISEGADIILPVAGPVGLGAAAAAQDKGNVSMIWVDTDGCVSAAQFCPLFLTSVQKLIDAAEITAIKSVIDGTYDGSTDYLGTLKNGGVTIAPFHSFDSKVPQALKDKLDELKKGIIDGSISVDPKDYL